MTAAQVLNIYEIQKYLQENCNIIQHDSLEVVTYKQWETTDRTTLHTYTKAVPEFIEDLVQKTEKLVSHDYVTRNQAVFLRNLKSKQGETEMIA